MLAGALHAAAPPVGLVDVSSFPASSKAMQSETDGQEIATMAAASMLTGGLQAVAPPVGFVEVTTLPLRSTATQSAVDGHVIPLTNTDAGPAGGLSILIGAVQVPGPAEGLVEVRTVPLASAATHSDVVGQDTPANEFSPSKNTAFQLLDPTAGGAIKVEVAT